MIFSHRPAAAVVVLAVLVLFAALPVALAFAAPPVPIIAAAQYVNVAVLGILSLVPHAVPVPAAAAAVAVAPFAPVLAVAAVAALPPRFASAAISLSRHCDPHTESQNLVRLHTSVRLRGGLRRSLTARSH